VRRKGLVRAGRRSGHPQWVRWLPSIPINALNAGARLQQRRTLGDTNQFVAGARPAGGCSPTDNFTGNDQVIAARGSSSVADLKGKSSRPRKAR